jgi:hypothetical protein
MLSIVILSAFTFLGMIVLPALAEIRSRRRDESARPDSGDDDEPVQDPDLPLVA